jgi:hypothetical protein
MEGSGRIRNQVVIFITFKLGKGCLCWQNPQHFPEIFQVLKNSLLLLLAYWYVYVSCLIFFLKVMYCAQTRGHFSAGYCSDWARYNTVAMQELMRCLVLLVFWV